ncbi:MAG: DegT/DnrJ/EryC1/StrS family aminotransferase [Balneolaceae bacterium]|nr:DegT/DnrJ/EryC1/StrS family aminotransferase [Balneolaceae bacterium]
MIPVNKPFLPKIDEYISYLNGIWDRVSLTNNGPLVVELEKQLESYLELQHLKLVSSGTIALQIAIKALKLKGEIITTPFSYVATTSSIVWQECEPTFVDIDPGTLNIDPQKIAAAINGNTTAILATHIFGNPCDIDAIMEIADEFDLKVIFDASHCFGSMYKGRSVYSYGDISTASFHATKVFQTVEGGAVVTKDADLAESVDLMRNFGHDGPLKFSGLGINGKNSEFHAAMGLCNLKYIDELLEVRRRQTQLYDDLLGDLRVIKPETLPLSKSNYSYYAVIFESESELLKVQERLSSQQIYTRRYFYPSLNKLDYVNKQYLPIAEDIAPRILCLPLFHDLKPSEQEVICSSIAEVIRKKVFVSNG